jgi:hypothetical protein
MDDSLSECKRLALSALEALLPKRPRFRGFIPSPVEERRSRLYDSQRLWLSWVFSSLGRFPP